MKKNDLIGILLACGILATTTYVAVITYHPSPKVTYFTKIIDKVDVKSGFGSNTKCVIIDMYGQRKLLEDGGPCLYLVGETVEVRQWDIYYVTSRLN